MLSTFADVAPTLKLLTLHGNKISSLQTGVFANMSSLNLINIDDNLLEDIPIDLLSDCVNLVQVSIQNNQVRNIDDALFNTLRYDQQK